MVLVFGELAWEAEGGQTLFHLSKHPQLLVKQPLLSLELEVHACSCPSSAAAIRFWLSLLQWDAVWERLTEVTCTGSLWLGQLHHIIS